MLLAGSAALGQPDDATAPPAHERPLPEFVTPADRTVDPAAEIERAPHPGLAALRRLVRQFDFEDPEAFPTDMPRGFYRVLTADSGQPGFPPFGKAELTEGGSASGKWCLMYELDGGSIATAIPAGTVTVFSHADYALLAKVRTKDLVNAAARVSVHLLDREGRRIPYSERTSPLIRTGGTWQSVSVDVPGDFDGATDLVFELQLLQPQQFVSGPEATDRPLVDDISGRAWFDDVEVWRIPRVELSTDKPGNVFTLPQRPMIEVALNDLATEPVVGDLVVRDLDGQEVQRERLEPGRGGGVLRVPFKPDRAGWYAVDLDVGEGGRVIVTRSLEVALLPPTNRHRRSPDALRFGIDLVRAPSERLDALVALADGLGVDLAMIGLWDNITDVLSRGERWSRLRAAVDDLLDRRIEPVMVLDEMPLDLARGMGTDTSDVLALLQPGRALAPSLQETLIDLGQHVPRWQLGRDGRLASMFAGDLRGRLATAERHLADLMPGPRLAVPWPGEYALDPALDRDQILVTVPFEVPPSSIAEYLQAWGTPLDGGSIGSPRFDLRFEAPPPDTYSTRDRIEDLMLRTLHAWRAGARSLTIDAPWTWSTSRAVAAVPSPEYAVWQQLASWLRDRRFGGEVRLGDGLRCWIAEGSQGSALVAWNESGEPGATARILLGADPIVLIDAFGNRTVVEPRDGVHEFEVTSTPILIDDVDMPLARFRAGFAVVPEIVPSMHQEHHHEMVFRNPWPVVMSGTVRILGPEGWDFNPRVVSFNVPAGGEARLPLIFSFSRNELAGTKLVQVEAHFAATREYAVTLEAPVEVGFDGVDLEVTWRLAQNLTTGATDLVLTHSITNRTDQYLSLEAFVIAPDLQQFRKAIPDLAPGQSAQKIFQIEDGAATLAGKTVRVGVFQSDGPVRLTQELEIPALGGE